MIDDGYDWFDDDRFDGGKIPRFRFIINQGVFDNLFQPKKPDEATVAAKAWKLAAEIIAKAKSD